MKLVRWRGGWSHEVSVVADCLRMANQAEGGSGVAVSVEFNRRLYEGKPQPSASIYRSELGHRQGQPLHAVAAEIDLCPSVLAHAF